ncbi:MAG: histidine phosphatase family protein [Candidatus Promineifilaceae bacterium]
MSKIYLVRHGQASFLSDDYDNLSPIGRKQAALLGDYWGKRGKVFHKLFVGPLRRHQQTFMSFAKGYEQHGNRLPTPVVNDDFIEHKGFELAQAVTPRLIKTDPFVAEHYREGMDRRVYLKIFRHIMLKWATGEVSHPEFESWQQFRTGANRGMAAVMTATERGQDAIVFTSGGTMGASVGYALELNDVQAIKLNWVIRNTAYAEFQFRSNDLSLTEFNAIPHIEGGELLTYV